MSPSERADAWIGRVIDGRYRVQARVGTGGMGAVYRVEHVRMGKVAAMKVLHRDVASQPEAVEHFLREVEMVSRLDHPNIVQTFDCGHEDGQLYLIMEYVRGEDLAGILWRDGPLAVPRALALAIQVCGALEEAHEQGVVHCDLKPDNIVCARRRAGEQVKVLDFGLAKLRESPEPGDGGLLAGTPGYMSPEQVRLERVDPRSDLYSLGATLYRLITGEVAFEAESPLDVMGRQLTDELVPPSLRAPSLRLPAAVDHLIARAMARRREDRYPSAAAMRDDLQAVFNLVTGVAPSRDWRDGTPAWPAPGTDSDDALERLQREDFDAFERQLRRRRRLTTFLGTPLAVAGVVLAGWACGSVLGSRPAATEKEPNDNPALAGPLSPGVPVQGRIGASRLDGQPDFDCYRIPGARGGRVVTARITAVADVDLVLELFDDRGRLLARANAAGIGAGESLGPLGIGPGEAFVRARPLWVDGKERRTEESAPYQLTVDWASPDGQLTADWPR